MAFPQPVIDDLLARTGRMRAVCNLRHGGQVHHIVPRYEGGSDDASNAIPLCPNCHSEVHAAYAAGRTTRIYTAQELRGHLERTIDLLPFGGALYEEVNEEDSLGLSLDTFRRSVDVNLCTQYSCIKHFAPLPQSAKVPGLEPAAVVDRSITVVSSINSIGDFGYPAYSAAKAGLAVLLSRLQCLSVDAVRGGSIVH